MTDATTSGGSSSGGGGDPASGGSSTDTGSGSGGAGLSGGSLGAGGAVFGSGGVATTGGSSSGTGGELSNSGGANNSTGGAGGVELPPPPTEFDNPIIKYNAENPTLGPGATLFTADGAAMVWNDKVYLYTGHDEAAENATGYRMFDWYLFESQDMVTWSNKGAVMRYDVFAWARGGSNTGNANAGEVVQRDDKNGDPKFYFYAPVEGGQSDYGISIGVAVADKPEGPFKDARGIPLIYLADTAATATHSWRNLDPTTFIDDDGRVYMYWGNGNLYWVELEEDMIHVKGEISSGSAPNMSGRTLPAGAIHVMPNPTNYTEAPFVHKHGDLYYMSYASGFPESISYATSSSPTGPWTSRGVILDERQGTGTVHQSIFDFNGASFISYHDASLPTGDDYRRSTCMDRLYYEADGKIKKVIPTTK